MWLIISNFIVLKNNNLIIKLVHPICGFLMAILPSTQLLQSHKVIFFRFVLQNFIGSTDIVRG